MSSSAAAPQQERTSLQALYALNKAAKRLARDVEDGTAQSQFVTPDCETALRARKNALYEVKQRVLETLHHEASRIEVHEIRESEYYCFYFGSWSFHSPVEDFSVEVTVDGRLTLPDFDTSCATTRTQLSLEEALVHIRDAFDIDANRSLDQRHLVAMDGEFIDIGWPTLDNQ